MVDTLAPEAALARREAASGSAARRDTLTASVLLVEGRPLVRDCLAHGIRAEWPQVQLATAGWDLSHAEIIGGAVDLCLVSLDAGGSLDLVRDAFPEAALVVLSDVDGYAHVSRAAEQGARGYFSTAIDLAVLVQGIRLVLMGGTAMPVAFHPRTTSIAAREAAPAALSRFSAELFTPKELEVLRSLATGRPNKLIAHELGICETTVKVHLRHIFRKLGTTNRTHAALLAREMLDEAD
jgi:DNA-binding NarL/FixJ family response regulator